MKICSRIIPLFFLFLSSQAFAQYTDIINTNRPGQSQGAFSVGKNVYQLEMGLGYGKEKHAIWDTKTTGMLTDYTFRLGAFYEELEISLSGSFQQHKIKYLNFGETQTLRDFSRNTLGAKFLLHDPYIKRQKDGPNLYSWRKNNKFQLKDLIPAVAVYVGVNFDSNNNPFIYENAFTISPKIALATQNNWLDGWVFVTNLILDRVSTSFPSYEYLLTLTKTMRTNTSIFVENHGIFSNFYSDQLLNFGAAQLINKNLQIDASAQVNFKDTPTKTYARIGVSYRLDKHFEDDYIEEKGALYKKKLKEERKVKRDEKQEERKIKKGEKQEERKIKKGEKQEEREERKEQKGIEREERKEQHREEKEERKEQHREEKEEREQRKEEEREREQLEEEQREEEREREQLDEEQREEGREREQLVEEEQREEKKQPKEELKEEKNQLKEEKNQLKEKRKREKKQPKTEHKEELKEEKNQLKEKRKREKKQPKAEHKEELKEEKKQPKAEHKEELKEEKKQPKAEQREELKEEKKQPKAEQREELKEEKKQPKEELREQLKEEKNQLKAEREKRKREEKELKEKEKKERKSKEKERKQENQLEENEG